jgi:hypothetical protein
MALAKENSRFKAGCNSDPATLRDEISVVPGLQFCNYSDNSITASLNTKWSKCSHLFLKGTLMSLNLGTYMSAQISCMEKGIEFFPRAKKRKRVLFNGLLFSIALLFGGFALTSSAYGATYYVCGNGATCNGGGTGWVTGNDANACTSKGAPCRTVGGGIGKMSGAGHTLIVGNGTYVNDPITGWPSGTAGNYTTIQAENVGGATIDMSSVTASWLDTAIAFDSSVSYSQVIGFRARGNALHNDWSNGPVLVDGNHNKLIRCAVYDAPRGNFNMQTVNVTGSYNLVEECWAWGGARYKFLVYQGDHNIVRRSVARHDYVTPQLDGSGFPNQEALFVTYDAEYTVFQNNIGIDSDYISNGQNLYGAFWFELNHPDDWTTHAVLRGSIGLNLKNSEAGIIGHPYGNKYYSDVVIWDSWGGVRLSGEAVGDGGSTDPTESFDHLTIGNINGTDAGTYHSRQNGFGSYQNYSGLNITNSIIYDATGSGMTDYATNDYIALYGNGTNYSTAETAHTPSAGAHNITNVNPLTNCLKYLPRIESTNCSLYTAGSGGGRIGAEILYRWGTDGTLYGQTGYDTLTSEPLWPFPNEALIKSDFASYSGPGPAGARGFATGTSMDGSPQTLTKYIWEYLGNQIPADIYGGGDTTPPSSPSGLRVL